MIKLKINVTERDIKKGERTGVSTCPVALAIKRHCDRKIGGIPNVNYGDVMIGRGASSSLYSHLPYEVKVFIRNFDAQLPVTPISFELTLTKFKS